MEQALAPKRYVLEICTEACAQWFHIDITPEGDDPNTRPQLEKFANGFAFSGHVVVRVWESNFQDIEVTIHDARKDARIAKLSKQKPVMIFSFEATDKIREQFNINDKHVDSVLKAMQDYDKDMHASRDPSDDLRHAINAVVDSYGKLLNDLRNVNVKLERLTDLTCITTRDNECPEEASDG